MSEQEEQTGHEEGHQEEKQPRAETESEYNILLEELRGKVRSLSIEEIKSPEKSAHVQDCFDNGVYLIAQAIIAEMGERGANPNEIYENYVWPIKDFARTALTNPLPKQDFQYEEHEVIPHEVLVADDHNWWQELTDKQKRALSEIVGLDLMKADTFSPQGPQKDTTEVIQQAKTPFTVLGEEGMSETTFYPVLIWHHHHGPSISCRPITK